MTRVFVILLCGKSGAFVFALDSQSHLLEMVGGACALGGRELSGCPLQRVVELGLGNLALGSVSCSTGG